MKNQDHRGPAPIKNIVYGTSRFYTQHYGFRPSGGVGDYYDANLDIFLENYLKEDWYYQTIRQSPYKQYLIGMNSDDSDQTYGFGAGPDFETSPDTGHNNSHLGWLVMTMSPLQTANADKGFVYQDSTVYSKKAFHDFLLAKYKTIGTLNAAWGASYSSFDSSGFAIANEIIGNGNGSTLTFSKTLAHPAVSQMSLQVSVNGTPVAGDLGPNADGQIWGANVQGTIDYGTGLVNLTFKDAPANGATITAAYIQNGWGIGDGLMDEDGRGAHQKWVGSDYVHLHDVNANLRADLDEFLYKIAAHYFSVCKSKIQAWMPGVLYLGPDSLGTWGAPSNRQVLKAASEYIDVMVMSGAEPLTQPMLDFISSNYGDKPIIAGEFRTANADSSFFQHKASISQSDYSTQAARGKDYYRRVTTYPSLTYSANGSQPYVGVLWWQYLDNWGEKNDWGLVSLSDNAYDGHESVTGSVPCSAPLSNYTCGHEARNYGDVITPVRRANQQVLGMLQNVK
jgi:hypothetical protein